MKTEREFIDSVYSKYELEKAKRNRIAKRNRTIYFYGGLAACFCFVVLGAIRVLPGLLEANGAVEADGLRLVSTAAPESYNGKAKVDVITYSLTGDAKTKDYYYVADEEAMEECAEEVIETPISAQTVSASGAKNSSSDKITNEYDYIKNVMLNVTDCSFAENTEGNIEIIVDGASVGVIYTSAVLFDDKADASDDFYFETQDSRYVIECGEDLKIKIVLSGEYFSEQDIEKITDSVKK